MYSYVGKMLFVNLTDKTYEVKPLEEKMAKDFLGGPALGARILYEHMPANADGPVPAFLGMNFMIVQQGLALLALIPIWLYRGRQGLHSKAFQYFCYFFYPVHMLLLFFCAKLLHS